MVDPSRADTTDVEIRPLREPDLAAATSVFQCAFGSFLNAETPEQFMADRNYIRSRWRADPTAALAAVSQGEIVGSNLATNWGSVGFLGPLSVTPKLWNHGVGFRLLEHTVALFADWQTAHAGLFTFPHSPQHVGLYQRFGFWPRYLTAVMSLPVTSPITRSHHLRYSRIPEDERPSIRAACRELTDTLYAGLDVEREILALDIQDLGDTVLLWDHDQLDAFAVCHCGAATEAGAGCCYIKFGAARPGPGVGDRFTRLVTECQSLAHAHKLLRLEAGVSLAREEAYTALCAAGFRTRIQGICMHRPHGPGYHRSGLYVLDDWR